MLEAVHPVLMSGDVAESLAWFARLGFTCAFSDDASLPRYAAVRRDGVELHLQWADLSKWVAGADRPTYRILVRDVDALFVELTGAGVTAAHDDGPWARPGDTPWRTREFHLRDPFGNGLQFYRPTAGSIEA
jgi:uncharacterized glyoxalase superfamily protein PhnB